MMQSGILGTLLHKIPQDPAYHHFADTRTMLGVPNALNVISNFPFLVIGVAGLLALRRGHAKFVDARERWPYIALFVGVTLTAFGSAWYHLNPNNATLVWDRLPMTLGFMGLLCAIVAERISVRLGLMLLVPLLTAGMASVLYWRAADDLRPYLLVQFGPILIIPVLLWCFPDRYTHTLRLVRVFGWYVAARILESLDGAMAGSPISGHTLKHLAAAWACWEIVRMLQVRAPAAV